MCEGMFSCRLSEACLRGASAGAAPEFTEGWIFHPCTENAGKGE